MKFTTSAVTLITLLCATLVAGAKTNEYGSVKDCQDDKNRIKHNWGSDVMLNGKTKSVFTNENFASYDSNDGTHCTGNSLGDFPKGRCVDTEKQFSSKVACLSLKVR
ncbi:hypothetical protein F5Y04DRAFT_287774 [Hypomontagnella monticulosa]|nr:hypothetical protein F5Y04DRAFT_287774 [Hypomontagnella monticulosa]